MSRPRALTPEQAVEARRLRELGWPVAQIRQAVAREAGEWNVRRAVAGIPWHRPNRKVDGLAALRLKAEGLTFNASAVAAFKAARRAARRTQHREAA